MRVSACECKGEETLGGLGRCHFELGGSLAESSQEIIGIRLDYHIRPTTVVVSPDERQQERDDEEQRLYCRHSRAMECHSQQTWNYSWPSISVTPGEFKVKNINM